MRNIRVRRLIIVLASIILLAVSWPDISYCYSPSPFTCNNCHIGRRTTGRVTDYVTALGISGALVATDVGGSVLTSPDGYYLLSSGNATSITVTFSAGGYSPERAVVDVSSDLVTKDAALKPACSSYLSPSTATYDAYESSGAVRISFNVAGTCGYNWLASSNASWITRTSGDFGTASQLFNKITGEVTWRGSVGYALSENTSSSSRTGTMEIGGNTFTVTQLGCGYAVAPAGASYAAGGGAGTISLTGLPASCSGSWAAVRSDSWISFPSGSSGSGSGTLQYSVAPNTGPARSGTITVAGQTVTIAQDPPCSYSITPLSSSYDYLGGGGSLSVSASPSGCTPGGWTAVSSNPSWITVTSGASGGGSGTVGYTVAAYSGSSPRSGTITVAGRTFTVAQSGLCAYDISPTARSFSTGGGTDSVTVTSQTSGCTGGWEATANASWITILSGSSGSGSGTVSYRVDENTGANTRSGTIAIAGRIFSITQEGLHLMAVPTETLVMEHLPVVSPVLDIDPDQARPFGSGDLAGGMVDLGVGFAGFAGPVDIYLGLRLPDQVSTEVWIIMPDLSVKPASEAIAPWREDVTEAVDEALYDAFPISLLPSGTYYLYTLVAPAGRLDSYYFWVTDFTAP